MKRICWMAGFGLLLAGLLAVSHTGAQDAGTKRVREDAEAATKQVKDDHEAASPDRQAIDAVNAEFTRAFNAGDAAALAALFTEDARMSDESGRTVEGKAAIQAKLNEAFRGSPGIKLEMKTDSVKFLSPEVAIEEGSSRIVPADAADGAADEFTPYTAIFVKQNGRWLHSVVRDYIVAREDDGANASGPEQLKELEWMVGNWVEEAGDSKATSSCKWAQNKHFLIWDYTIEDKGAHAAGGTSYIGWDPLTGQIKSWVFDAEGGHGEATWTRHGDGQWVVKASGVLGDGRVASATQYVTLLGNDRASWTSVDRVAGGEVEPDMSEYILVRQPPGPGTDTKAPKSR